MLPDQATIDALEARVRGLGFLTGTAGPIADAGLEIAWDLMELGLSTNVLSTGTSSVACDIYSRPTGWLDAGEPFRELMLHRTDLVQVNSVTVLHDLFECDCSSEEVSGCAVIYHEVYGILRVENCTGPASCGCSAAGRPVRLEICYQAGKWPSIAALPNSIIVAFALVAQWWAEVIETGGDQASSGFIDSWRSMDYSESLGFLEKNVFGMAPQLAAAWQLARRYRVHRAVTMRSYYPTQAGRRYGYGLHP